MKYHTFDPTRIVVDIETKKTSEGNERVTIIHSPTGIRLEALCSAEVGEITKTMGKLRSDLECILRCIFVDLIGLGEKLKLVRKITTAQEGSFTAPLTITGEQARLERRLGAALVSAEIPLEDGTAMPSGWSAWTGGEAPVHQKSVVAVLLRNRRVFTVFSRDTDWKHHDCPWDVIAYSTEADVIAVVRSNAEVFYA